MFRKLVKLALFTVVFLLIARFCHRQTDGFQIYKIRSALTPRAEWNVPRPAGDEKVAIEAILQQPFYYLAKGAQSYVFESEDGKYVLKFFRIYHLTPSLWVTALPSFLKYKQNKIASKQRELVKDFNSYKIAYDELKEETGIVYLHLNKSRDWQMNMSIYDKLGIAHQLNVDDMEFVLQKKVSLLYPAIDQLMREQKREKAKQAISQLVGLLVKRCEKGIFDKDPDLNTNFGLIDGTPIQLDIGRYRRDPSRKQYEIYRNDIIRTTDHFHQWLEAHHPELDVHLKQTIQNLNSAL